MSKGKMKVFIRPMRTFAKDGNKCVWEVSQNSA